MVKKITKTEIIKLFLADYSRRYYLREMSDILGKPHQTIKPYAEQLVKEQVLKKIERKNITEYCLNLNKAYDYITIAEKENTMERLNKDTTIRILYEKLSKFFTKSTFIIFGSASKSTKKESDIDILIVGKQIPQKTIEEFEETYSKEIHTIHIASIDKLSAALTSEIYKKHLILNNTENIIRYFGELHEKNLLV